LGRHAALEFESATDDNQDYLTSVRRHHSNLSLVSQLKPMKLLLKVDPIAAGVENPGLKIREFTQQCLKHGFDGLIVEN